MTALAARSTLEIMSYEVELKFRLVNHDRLLARLGELDAHAEPAIDQEDIYLSHPSRDFSVSHEAFRIRRIGTENRITYKGPRKSGPTKTREEIEISLSPGTAAFEQLLRLFESLGFRPIATIRKVRVSMHLTEAGQNVEVALDKVAGLGDFAEVETLAASECELPAAQAAILKLAQELGLTEVEPRSYLRMTLESST